MIRQLTRKCYVCEKTKPITEFAKKSKEKYRYAYICVECNRKQVAEWRKKNKERIRQYSKKYYHKNKERFHEKYLLNKEKYEKTRLKLIEYMGGKCEICEYDKDIVALDIHHRNEQGNIWNKTKHPLTRANIMKKWISEGIPDYLVLLCSNCHRIHHYSKSNVPLQDESVSPPTRYEDVSDESNRYKEVSDDE